MTQRHAMRRGVTPRPSEKDERLLRRLIVRAKAVAADAARDGKPFVIAAEKAGKAILPVGHQQNPDSPFVALIRLGKRWLLLNVTERLAAAGTVRELAEACGEALDVEAGGQRRLPYAED